MPNSTFGLPGNPIINKTNVVTGSATAVQFPDLPCIRVKFKARTANIGNFYVGASSASCTWELDAAQELDWIDVNNLNLLWHSNPSGTVDQLTYWLQD